MENYNVKSLEELKEELKQKINQELYKFKEDLLQKKSKEVIESAYELVCKQEITDYLSYDKYYTRPELEALLNSKNILSQAFNEWLDDDGKLGEMLEYSTDDCIDLIVKDYKEEKQNNKDSISSKKDAR